MKNRIINIEELKERFTSVKSSANITPLKLRIKKDGKEGIVTFPYNAETSQYEVPGGLTILGVIHADNHKTINFGTQSLFAENVTFRNPVIIGERSHFRKCVTFSNSATLGATINIEGDLEVRSNFKNEWDTSIRHGLYVKGELVVTDKEYNGSHQIFNRVRCSGRVSARRDREGTQRSFINPHLGRQSFLIRTVIYLDEDGHFNDCTSFIGNRSVLHSCKIVKRSGAKMEYMAIDTHSLLCFAQFEGKPTVRLRRMSEVVVITGEGRLELEDPTSYKESHSGRNSPLPDIVVVQPKE